MFQAFKHMDWKQFFVSRADLLLAFLYAWLFLLVRISMVSHAAPSWAIAALDCAAIVCAAYFFLVIAVRLYSVTSTKMRILQVDAHPEQIFYRGSEEEFAKAKWHLDKPEYIYGSAIRHPSGILFVVLAPGRHHHCIRAMYQEGCARDASAKDQGFITSWGRYVDRVEALAIAKTRNQIRHKTGNDKILFSEDVW